MRSLIIGAALVGIVVLLGCGTVNETESPVLVDVALMDFDSTEVEALVTLDLNSLSSVDLGGEDAVNLTNLVPVTLVQGYTDKNSLVWDTRPLYDYRLVGSDGFSPDNRIDTLTGRAYENLDWIQLGLAFIKNPSRDVAYDAALVLPGRYRIRDVATIEIYRKVEVITGTDTVSVELVSLNKVMLNDTVAIRLSDILAVSDTTGASSFVATAVDGFSNSTAPFTRAQIQTGYWLLEQDITYFTPDLGIGGKQRISHVKQIAAQ